jgi:hypothetical protein
METFCYGDVLYGDVFFDKTFCAEKFCTVGAESTVYSFFLKYVLARKNFSGPGHTTVESSSFAEMKK